jgi:tuftelin-interacting protein 11
MDEEQANERFDVDNDYEGGQWIGGEFFHAGKRRKRQQVRVCCGGGGVGVFVCG